MLKLMQINCYLKKYGKGTFTNTAVILQEY